MTINNPLADNSPDHEDQNLVLRARSGDRQALEDLVERHQAWIYNIAVRMLHHPQDAEDVTQEILIKVLTRRPAGGPRGPQTAASTRPAGRTRRRSTTGPRAPRSPRSRRWSITGVTATTARIRGAVTVKRKEESHD